MKNKKRNFIILLIIALASSLIYGYIYLTKGEKYKDDLYWLTQIPIAHRGLFDEKIPENSLEAFDNAMEKNYAIELDVQLTKDKQLVVFHDKTLERMTGDKRNLADVNYEELKNLKLLNTEETIPLLSEVLAQVDGRVPILIEIKDCENILELGEATYNVTKDYKGQYSVQSFNPFVLEWYKINAPEVVRGQLSGTFTEDSGDLKWYEGLLLENLMLNFKSRPNFISYELKGLPKLRVEQLRKDGIPTLSWTIRTKEDMDKAYKYGDNIIFDSMLP